MKRSAKVLIISGVLLLIFAFTVPPFITGQARTVPKNLDITLVSESPQGFELKEHITTEPTDKIDEIATHVSLLVTDAQGKTVADITDDLELIGHSRYPVIEPVATISGSPSDSSNEVRDGLQYFFPANTLRNSYPYYDIVLGDAYPVDYVTRDDNIYTFYQHLQDLPLAEGGSYSVERTLRVDRLSGIIVEKNESMTFHETVGDRQIDFAYTQATQEKVQDFAESIDTQLAWAKGLDFFAKFFGLVLLTIGVFQTGIFKRGRLVNIVSNYRK